LVGWLVGGRGGKEQGSEGAGEGKKRRVSVEAIDGRLQSIDRNEFILFI
jgi:hypothetical protein